MGPYDIKKCDTCYQPIQTHKPYCKKCEWYMNKVKAGTGAGNVERRKDASKKFQVMLKHDSGDPSKFSK